MRKKRLQRAVGEGARQQRVRIEYHLGEGKPNESAVYRTMCRNSSRFSREFPVTETAYACACIRTCFKGETRVVCGKNMVRPWLSWGGFFYAETPVIQPGKKQILLPNTRRQEKGGNI